MRTPTENGEEVSQALFIFGGDCFPPFASHHFQLNVGDFALLRFAKRF
jgi:hypothetical protein